MRAHTHKTIQKRLAHIFSTTMTATMITLFTVLGSIAIGFLVYHTNNFQDRETRVVEAEIANWYTERMAEVRIIRDTIEYYDMTASEEYDLAGYLANELSKSEGGVVYDYYVGLEDATCYFGGGWEPEPGEYDPRTRDWYIDAKEKDGVVISSAYVDADSGRIVITISVPIKREGATVGVLAADIFTDDIQAIASGYFDEKSTKYAILVDSA